MATLVVLGKCVGTLIRLSKLNFVMLIMCQRTEELGVPVIPGY